MKTFITSLCMTVLLSCGVYAQFTIESGVLTAYTGTEENITLPDEVTAIKEKVFEGNKSIKAITGKNVLLLGNAVFNNCSALTTVDFPAVETINQQAFRNCTALVDARFGSVKTIGNDGFLSCHNIESFDFSKLHSVGTDAFTDCRKLGPTITLPASLVSYGGNSFAGCLSLQNILIDPANEIWKSVDGILLTKDEITPAIATYPSGRTGAYKLPDEIVIVGFGAFARSQLSTLDLSYADEIGEYGLYMSKITSLTANHLRTTKLASFRNVQLESLALPELRNLGQNTFQQNSKLKTIDLSKANKLTTIGNAPFHQTTIEVTVYVATEEIKSLLAEKCPSNVNIIVDTPSSDEELSISRSKLFIEAQNQVFSIDVDELPAGHTIRVYDLEGRLMMTQYISENNTANLYRLQKGVYIIQLGACTAKIKL